MMYNDYDGGTADWDSYTNVPMNEVYEARQRFDQDQFGGHQPHHDGPDNPFDDPFFNNFLKGLWFVYLTLGSFRSFCSG